MVGYTLRYCLALAWVGVNLGSFTHALTEVYQHGKNTTPFLYSKELRLNTLGKRAVFAIFSAVFVLPFIFMQEK